MKIEIFTFCLGARPGMGGELHILGAVDTISVQQFPAAITCNVVARIRFEKIEEGVKELKFSFVDSDGKPVMKSPPPQKVNIQIPAGAPSASAGIVFGMQNVQIPSAGEYEIGLAVNERHEISVPLYVRQFAQQSTQQ
jgi:hypothetical protein